MLAAHRAVAAVLGIVVERGVADDRPVLVAERVEARHQALVGGVLGRRLGVGVDPLQHRADVVAAVRLVVVEADDAVLRPLGDDVLGRRDAVHVVDDGAAAERLTGERSDRPVLRGGEAGAVIELLIAGQLELLEVLLVAVAAHLEHEHLLAGGGELGGDHRSAGARADDTDVSGQRGCLAADLLDGDRLRRRRRIGRRAYRPRGSRWPPSSGWSPARREARRRRGR